MTWEQLLTGQRRSVVELLRDRVETDLKNLAGPANLGPMRSAYEAGLYSELTAIQAAIEYLETE